MTKMWLQDWLPAGKNEESVLGALAISPVAIGVFISNNIYAYSGGLIQILSSFFWYSCHTAVQIDVVLSYNMTIAQ